MKVLGVLETNIERKTYDDFIKNGAFINNSSNSKKRNKEMTKMKFDHIIGNPPFNQNLHLKILDKVLDKATKSVAFIHPSTLFASPRLAFEETTHYKRHKRIFENVTELKIIPAKESNAAFGIYLMTDLCISQFDRTKEIQNHRTKFVENKMNVTLAQKIMKKSTQNSLTSKQSRDKEFKMQACKLFGSGGQTTDIFAKTFESAKNSRGNFEFSFKTDNERKNFYNAYMLPFFRKYQVLLWKNDHNKYLRYLPWLNDYTKPWTNERLYKFFKLTENEIKYIESKYDQPDRK